MANGTPPPIPGYAWVDTAARLVTTVGVPTVFAAYLLWFVTTRVGATLEVIEANEQARTKMLQETQNVFVTAIEGQTVRFEQALKENRDVGRELILTVQKGAPK